MEGMQVQGKFEVKVQPEPPFDTFEGVALGRVTVNKTFAGPLEASSQVHMLAAHTPVQGSGVYVAIERIRGSVEGKQGSFVVIHTGIMKRGEPSLTISIAPDSGTGELTGISGTMDIQIVEGQHSYTLDYELK
jgi:hypothetical protein